jgi:hypothetical protein
MAATGVQLNWSNVSFASTPITRVTSCGFDEGINIIYFSGDQNIYNVIAATSVNTPTCSITGGDIATLFGFAGGSVGTVLATLNDARGQSGGAINFSLANAIYSGASFTSPHAQFGSATATWGCTSSDGITNPLTFSRS